MRIEIWSDVVCPWCYVGKRRLETALAGFAHRDEVEVVYRSFELDPGAPRHGHEPSTEVLARKYRRTDDEIRDMQQQLIDLAAQEGLALRLFDTVHTSTVDAHRVLHLALATGGAALQGRLKEALLAAYFAHARDIGDHDVLRAAAASVGLDAARVEEVLASDEYADEVAADVAQARAYGATGVPFFVLDQRYGISGAQPAEVFASALEQAWAASRPQLSVVGGDDAAACGPDGCAC
ncbi:DsbA family oxidoreductase [uncultured Nocardioides sp.]|uniref:DsbA family oxidoreductase n=1 Tax=uncultured Nocardioides sp. TaxID=198441 RepID=UPI0025FCFB57|nr:DsbA family oxidoreductase [uncultured Nocardioides sp.]